MRKSRVSRQLKHSPPQAPPQGASRTDWANLGIAVPREFKQQFEAFAVRLHISRSVLGRQLLIPAFEEAKRRGRAA